MHKDEITDRLYLIAEAIDVILDRCIKYKHRTTSFPHLGEWPYLIPVSCAYRQSVNTSRK